jgi:hypothetical protein
VKCDRHAPLQGIGKAEALVVMSGPAIAETPDDAGGIRASAEGDNPYTGSFRVYSAPQ